MQNIKEYFTIEENMKGKSAFMTGGTKGIGAACVRTFIEAGVNVVFVGRSVQKGKELEEELNALNKGQAIFMECDVLDYDRLAFCINSAAEQLGKLDFLLNCAAYFLPVLPVDNISIDEFIKLLKCNVVGYFVAAKTALPYLRRTKGSIVNIGSVTDHGQQGCAAYTAAKGAIHSLTKTLAIDEARYGVRVNGIKPGHINTDMFYDNADRMNDREKFIEYSDSLQWMGRGGEPEEVARAVLFLASDWASYITGTEIFVTGGYEIGEGPKPINPFAEWPEVEIK